LQRLAQGRQDARADDGGRYGRRVVAKMDNGRAGRNRRSRRKHVVREDRRAEHEHQVVLGGTRELDGLLSESPRADEQGPGWRMDEEYVHNVINHAETYVQGNVHTNTLENFWSLLKRGLHGTYISVEPFHLFRYIDEQAFRYNNRLDANGNKISDYERFKAALSQIVGRRLTYKELIGKEGETTEATT